MIFDPLRLYLLAGLVAHKTLWEWMKRRRPPGTKPTAAAEPAPERTLRQRLVRVVKLAILAGLVVQTLIPPESTGPLRLPADAFPWRSIGALVYTLGLALAVLGRWQLGDNWEDIEAARTLSGQRVVDHGVYRWIRHPIYVGDLLLVLGLELAVESWLVLAALALVPVVLRQAIREERMLVASLDGYADYCRRSKRFVPFLV